MKRFFERFTLQELVTAAVMAALGIAVKPLVSPIAHVVCGPLMIPSGALAGGLYMMWLVIGYAIVRKQGTAVMISAVQALVVVFTGIIGSHGIISIVTYILPGIAAEIVFAFDRRRNCSRSILVLGCMAANLTGTAAVNIIFFQAPGIYLVLILVISAVSGLAGGILSYQLAGYFVKDKKKICGWVDDVDEYIEENSRIFAEEKEKRKKAGWIGIVAAVLILAGGVLAWLNYSSMDGTEGSLSISVQGEKVLTLELEEVEKLASVKEQINLSSTSHDDAVGEFKGVLLSTVLETAGIREEYPVIVLSSEDGYSSAADWDEIDDVLIAYEKDGDTLGLYSNGGMGPLRAIYMKDTYATRSVMNVVRIDLEK